MSSSSPKSPHQQQQSWQDLEDAASSSNHGVVRAGPQKQKTVSLSTLLQQLQSASLSPQQWRRSWSRFLQRYTTAMSHSVHRDRLLKTLQYTLWWYTHILLAKNGSRNKRLAAVASNLSNEITWARYITRMVEWPMAWEALFHKSWTPSWASVQSGSSDKSQFFRHNVGQILGQVLAASMCVYYPAEHAAFGYWKLWAAPSGTPSSSQSQSSPPPPPTRWAEQYSAWSCRAWLVYILTDLVQGYVALTTTPTPRDDQDAAPDEEQSPQQQQLVVVAAAQKARHKQYVIMARNLLFLLPAYHWSLPNWDKRPWLTSTTVNTFMWLEAVLSLYQSSLEVE